MTRIYIAGPMTGYELFNYPAFNLAEDALRRAGYDPINPVQGEEPPDPDAPPAKTYNEYLRSGLRLLLDADAVALLDGWERSRGACLEAEVAARLDMPAHRLVRWTSGPAPSGAGVVAAEPVVPRTAGGTAR